MTIDIRSAALAVMLATSAWASSAGADEGLSRDALFDDQPSADQPSADQASRPKAPEQAWKGFAQGELARTTADPAHWSKARLRLDLSRQGQLSEQVKWKIGGRFDYDAVYDRSGFYPEAVRQDQRAGFALRENYLDISAGDWDFRLGRQHVVWGEMVGLFVADVVSAKDLREFLLPEFEVLRIPQWAARAEYFKGDWHAEMVWIPAPSFDEIGKPGADFYPYPIPGPGGTVILNEDLPSRKLANSNYGLRLSMLNSGWDVSGFYYHSLDAEASFYRQVTVPITTPVFIYRPRHDPIDQLGATMTRDLDWAVLKGEAVYTDGRRFNVTRLSQADGLVRQNTFDYALGLDISLPAETRLNLQFFQRLYTDHDPDTLQDKVESGASVLVNGKLGQDIEGQLLLISSLNRSDRLIRPRLAWNIQQNWRLMVGADVFHGPATGLFGRYDNKDRLYTELRYSF